jgi:hypothetical protein
MREIIRRGLGALGIRTLPQLDEQLATRERVFRAPPFTEEMVAAIKLVTPHFELTTSEKSRAFWEADQNGSCWGEFDALAPVVRSIPRPGKILEIGPGLGRSLVFFSKKLGWENSEIHAYEGEGNTTKNTVLGPRFDDSFCGNIKMLRHVLEYNNIRNVTVFNSRNIQLAELPGPYDFIYSFYSVGFHWSLEHFLDDLLKLMHDKSVAVFTTVPHFRPFPEMRNLAHSLVDFNTVWPKNGKLKMLIIGKKSMPRFLPGLYWKMGKMYFFGIPMNWLME